MKDYNEGIFEDSYFVSCVLENKFENIFRKYDISYDGNEKIIETNYTAGKNLCCADVCCSCLACVLVLSVLLSPSIVWPLCGKLTSYPLSYHCLLNQS